MALSINNKNINNTFKCMQLLGHRNINSTLVYTQPVNFESDDEFHVKTAKTTEELRNCWQQALNTLKTMMRLSVSQKKVE